MVNQYSLEARTYVLDPNKVMAVISDLRNAISMQKWYQRGDDSPTPVAFLLGRDRTMKILGEHRETKERLSECELGN